MPRPKARDIGASLPAGFGGQQSLSAMWFQPPSSCGPPAGWTQQPIVQAPPGIVFAPSSTVAEDEKRGRFRRMRSRRSRSATTTRSRRKGGSSWSDSDSASRSRMGSAKKRRKRRATSSDDDIPNSYRWLGGKHIYGDKACLPKAQKVKALKKCNEEEFNPLRLAAMEDHNIDELMFLATNCPPTLRLSDLKIRRKGDLRDLLGKEYQRTMKHHPSRMSTLAPDYSNLSEVARKAGYPARFLVADAQGTPRDGAVFPKVSGVAKGCLRKVVW